MFILILLILVDAAVGSKVQPHSNVDVLSSGSSLKRELYITFSFSIFIKIFLPFLFIFFISS